MKALPTSLMLMFGLLVTCHPNKQNTSTMKNYDTIPGTFGFDLAFMTRYQEAVVLSDSSGMAHVMIIPGWQARVMTSSANGPAGFSYGWINYKLISSGEKAEHINAYGGEERLWLGPEGGPFSIYFAPGVNQEFSNWYVPAELDTLAFDLVSKSATRAVFSKKFSLANYSGTKMDIGIERTVSLLDNTSMAETLGMDIPDSVKGVAYQSDNVLINLGQKAWTKENGMLSIWMLAMLTPSPGVTIFIPYKSVFII